MKHIIQYSASTPQDIHVLLPAIRRQIELCFTDPDGICRDPLAIPAAIDTILQESYGPADEVQIYFSDEVIEYILQQVVLID